MKLANFRKSVLSGMMIMFVVALFAVVPIKALAITLITDINIDTAALSSGYTVESQNGKFKLGIFPEVLSEESRVVLKQFDRNEYTFPGDWTAVSDVYEFDIYNKDAFKNKKPLIIRISADAESTHLKKVFFWNGVSSEWLELPSTVIDAQTMNSVLHLPYAKVVLL
ncbi:MAG: hypothetical protein AAB575_03580 [Patescibacteria group bacterium]